MRNPNYVFLFVFQNKRKSVCHNNIISKTKTIKNKMIKIECSFVFYSLVVETVGLSKGMFPYVKLSKRSSIFLEKYLLHLRCASSQKRCPILGEKFYFSFHFWLHHLWVGSFWTYLLVEIYLYVQNIFLLSYDTDILLQGRPS